MRRVQLADIQDSIMKMIGQAVWRTSAVLALVTLLLPLIGLVLAASIDDNSSLPACCRRHGEHRCIMRVAEGAQESSGSTSSTRVTQFSVKCPYSAVITQQAASHPLWHGPDKRSFFRWTAGRIQMSAGRSNPSRSECTANYKRGPPRTSSHPLEA
jgi:hypothetical protein